MQKVLSERNSNKDLTKIAQLKSVNAQKLPAPLNQLNQPK